MHYRKWEMLQENKMKCGKKLTAIFYDFIGEKLKNLFFKKK